MKLCGNAPRVIAHVDLSPVEMMAWLYCPIKLPGNHEVPEYPDNLFQFDDIVYEVYKDLEKHEPLRWHRSYVYLTAKTLFATPENPGNRPGWHCDGYGSEDLNYIWADRNPTLFWVPEFGTTQYPDDHTLSMGQMTANAAAFPEYLRTYPDKTLLRLDETVIHNVAPCLKPGWRTFVKVSVSSEKYLLAGNSINHELAPDWDYVPREENRNDPLTPLRVGDGHYEK